MRDSTAPSGFGMLGQRMNEQELRGSLRRCPGCGQMLSVSGAYSMKDDGARAAVCRMCAAEVAR